MEYTAPTLYLCGKSYGCNRELPADAFSPSKLRETDDDVSAATASAPTTASFRERDPDKDRRTYLKHTYKITLAEYDELRDAQGGRCTTCHRHEDGLPEMLRAKKSDGTYSRVEYKLFVDHDHACCPGERPCGECIRGLLCHDCNVGLGSFKDDPALLTAAIEYLLNRAKPLQ